MMATTGIAGANNEPRATMSIETFLRIIQYTLLTEV